MEAGGLRKRRSRASMSGPASCELSPTNTRASVGWLANRWQAARSFTLQSECKCRCNARHCGACAGQPLAPKPTWSAAWLRASSRHALQQWMGDATPRRRPVQQQRSSSSDESRRVMMQPQQATSQEAEIMAVPEPCAAKSHRAVRGRRGGRRTPLRQYRAFAVRRILCPHALRRPTLPCTERAEP